MFLSGGNSPSQVQFNFILQGKAGALSPAVLSSSSCRGFLCFRLLLVADNNSANGFGNRKFPLGLVVCSSLWGNGIKNLQYINSFIVFFFFFPSFLSTEINSGFSQDTPSLPRKLLSPELGSACLGSGERSGNIMGVFKV